MKACLIKTLSIHVYVLEIGQRLVSRYRATRLINDKSLLKQFLLFNTIEIQYPK